MRNEILIEIKGTLPPFAKGQKVRVETDKNRIPLDKFWRDRLKDAEVDGCVSIVSEKKSKPKKEGN